MSVPIGDPELPPPDPRGPLLRALFDALPDPVLVTDPRSRVLFENRRAREIFTFDPEADETRRHRVEVNNFLFTSFLARGRTLAGGPRELVLMDPGTGEELAFEGALSPLDGDPTLPGATVSLLRDVTELRRASALLGHESRRVRAAEARAAEERDRLNLIVAHAGAPIVVTDAEGRVLLMNREAHRLFGTGSEASGPQAENSERFFAALDEALAAGDARGEARLALAEPDAGAPLSAELVAGVVLDGDGSRRAVVSILRDLTQAEENARLAEELSRVNAGLERSVAEATAELREQNRRLAWQGAELERAYRHKSEFLASMSHELRTPINALLGYTALLRERIYGPLTERQDDALTRMEGASAHLLELVNDVLDLARIEAGRMPLHLRPVALGELVRQLAESVEPLARSRGLELSLDLPADLPPMMTDPTRMRQIVLNLLSNAVKFTREGGVSLVARPAGEDAVEIAVADTGVGIPPDELARIFDDFRQADQSSTREFPGTGLGLSIVRKLLGLLGGSIRVESTPGEGSVFTVTVPLRSAEVPEGEEAVRRALQGEAVVVREGASVRLPVEDPRSGAG